MKKKKQGLAIIGFGCLYCRMSGVNELVIAGRYYPEGETKVFVQVCAWHRSGICAHNGMQVNCATCIEQRGPSMYHTKRDFMESFGSGVAQLAEQDRLIAVWKKGGLNTAGDSSC